MFGAGRKASSFCVIGLMRLAGMMLEEFVFEDRAADGEAELPVPRLGAIAGEVFAGARVLVVAEEPDAAVNVVRARFDRHRTDCAASPTQLCVEVRGRHADGFNRVRRRNQHRQQSGLMVVVHAFDHKVVREARLAVDLRLQAVLRVEKFGVRARRARSAWHRHQQSLEIAVEAERQFGHLLGFDQPPCVSAVSLQDRRRAGFNGHGLADFADLHHQINTDGGVDVDCDVVAGDLLEAFQTGLDTIDAVLDAREDVVAVPVGRGCGRDVGASFSRGYRRADSRRSV